MKKIVFLAVLIAGVGAYGAHSYLINWDTSKAVGNYADSLNWIGGVVPYGGATNKETNVTGYYANIPTGDSDITIKIPSGTTFNDDGGFYVATGDKTNGRTVTLDSRGAVWKKSAKAVSSKVEYAGQYDAFRYYLHSASAVNNIGEVRFSAEVLAVDSDLCTMSNAVVRFVTAPGGADSVWLDQGLWKWQSGNFRILLQGCELNLQTNSQMESSFALRGSLTSINVLGGTHKFNGFWLHDGVGGLNGAANALKLNVVGEAFVEIANLFASDKTTGNAHSHVILSNNAQVVCNNTLTLGAGNSSGSDSANLAGNTGVLILNDDSSLRVKDNFRIAYRTATTGLVEVLDRANLISDKKISVGVGANANTFAQLSVGGEATVTAPAFEGLNIGATVNESEVIFNGGKWVVPSGKTNAGVKGLSHFVVGENGMTIEANSDVMIDQEIEGNANISLCGNGRVTFAHDSSLGNVYVSNYATIGVKGGVSLSIDDIVMSGTKPKIFVGKNSCITFGSLDNVPGRIAVVIDDEGVNVGDSWEVVRMTSGSADASKFLVVNGSSGKEYSLVVENGGLKVNVSAVRAGRTFTWNGGASGAWDTAANWDKGTVPGISDTVEFGVASDTTVTIGSNLSVRNIVKNGSGKLTFNGVGALTVSGSEGVSIEAGSLVANVYIDLPAEFSCSVATGSSLEFGGELYSYFGKVSFKKSGLGSLTISGDNAALEADWIIPGGVNTFKGPTAFGIDNLGENGLVLSNNTFRYEGAAASVGRCIKFLGTNPVRFDLAGDLTLREYKAYGKNSSSAAMAYVKTGVGTLTLELASDCGAFIQNYTSSSRGINTLNSSIGVFAEPVNGMISDWNGLVQLNVFEGTFCIKGNGKDVQTIPTMNVQTIVGGSGYKAVKTPELKIEDVKIGIGGSGMHMSIGRKMVADSAQPALTLVNADLTEDTVHVGDNRDVTAGVTVNPALSLNNSTFLTTYNFAMPNIASGRATVQLSNNSLLHRRSNGIQGTSWDQSNHEFSIQSGSSLTIKYDCTFYMNLPQSAFSVTGGGAKIDVGRFMLKPSTSNNEYSFNGGKLQMNINDSWSAIKNPQNGNCIMVGADGMSVVVTNGITHTSAILYKGTGKVAKEGAGIIIFAKPSSFSSTTSTMLPENIASFQNDGGLKVAEGMAVLSEGVFAQENNAVDVEVNAGATLSLGNNSFAFASLAGDGTVANGTLALTALKHKVGQSGVMTFKDVTMNGRIDVDFGSADGEGLTVGDKFIVANLDNVTGSPSWKSVNTGDKKKVSFETKANGNVEGAVVSTAGMIIIIK